MRKFILYSITSIYILSVTNLQAMVSELGTQMRPAGRYMPRTITARPFYQSRPALPYPRAYTVPHCRGFAIEGYPEIEKWNRAREISSLEQDLTQVLANDFLSPKEKVTDIINLIYGYGINNLTRMSPESLQYLHHLLNQYVPNHLFTKIIAKELGLEAEPLQAGLAAIPFEQSAQRGVISRVGRGVAAALIASAAYSYFTDTINEAIDAHESQFDLVIKKLMKKPFTAFLSEMDHDEQYHYLKAYLLQGGLLGVKRTIGIPTWYDMIRLASEAIGKRRILWESLAWNIGKAFDPLGSEQLEKEWARSNVSVEDFVRQRFSESYPEIQKFYPHLLTTILKEYEDSFN